MRTGLRFASALAALAICTVVVVPGAAARTWETASQTGTQAYAWNDTCTDNTDGTITCAGQSINVFKGTTKSSGGPNEKGQQVCYSDFTSTFDPITGAGVGHGLFGCETGGRTLAVEGLTSVALAPTTIELVAVSCDTTTCTESPGGSITVHGSWTGTGQITRQSGKHTFDDGTCLQVNAEKGSFRAASFEGSIASSEASLGEGTFRFRTSCTF